MNFTSFLEQARKLVLKEFRADSCIATTAVICDVLLRHGFNVRPIMTECCIFNEAMVAHVNREGWPQSPEIAQQWFTEDGSWAVGIKQLDSKTGVGHLVALVQAEDKFYLLDGSLDQASRPKKDIVLGPVAFEVRRPFLEGRERALTTINRCVVAYEPDFDDKTFAMTPDWLLRDRRAGIVTELLAHGLRKTF